MESSETPDWLVLLDREGPDLAVVLDEQYRIVWGSHSNTAITGITGPSDTSSLLEPTSLAPFVEAVAESRRRPGEAVPLEFSFRCPIGVVRAHGWLVDISHTRPGHTLLRFCILDHPQDPATPRGDGESNRASPRSGDQGDALDEPLHLMAEMSTLGLGMALPGGHLLYRNRAFEEWFPARVVDGLRGIAEAVRPEAAGALREWVDKVTRGESASVIVPLESGSEHRWLRLDGAERTSATLGRLHGITVQDVSEVVAGRDSMRQVLDLMPVMVFASDLDGRVKFANQTGRTFLGTCSEELDDLRLGSILGEIVGEDLLHTIGDLTGTGHVVADLENTVKALDGTEHHLRTWLLPFQDASSGENTILVVANDETRQVANEALLTALGRNMADLAIISHFDGGRSFVSASVQELLGWAPDEFLTFPVLDTIHPDDIAKSAVIRDPELSSAGSSHTLELRLLHRDGTWRWFEVNATNLSNVPAIRGMLIFGHDIMARKARDQQLEFEATHDPLTSLLNRSAIIDRLEHALGDTREHGTPVGALFVDLDNFKLVNDALGHETGDSLLRDVATAMEGALREGDSVGRLGGDEFLVIVRDVDDEETVLRVAQRVSDSVASLTRDTSYPITLSVGICLSFLGDTTAGAMVRDADAAMYRAKVEGKARTQLFHSAIDHQATRRLEVSRQLASALEEGRFAVHFQPVFCRRPDGLWQVRALEALARCPLEDGSMLRPDEFVPVAEQTGLIVPMGHRVTSLAFQALRRWHHLGYEVQVWVNLSASELSHPELADHLVSGLRRAGLPTSALGVEITESMLGEAHGVHDSLIHALRSAGITVLIDDFGTGYSSLGALKDTPIDIAKIDRSFTAGMLESAPDTAIVRSVINIGSVMGFEVVAEGVESLQQLHALNDLECHNVQGWLFTKARPAEEITSMLPKWIDGFADEEIEHLDSPATPHGR